jgi:tRNA pseudouridine38-40 synthase
MRTTTVSSPFDRAYSWHLPERLDLDAMRRAAAMLVGEHDFAAFQSTGTEMSSTVRTISRSELLAVPSGADLLMRGADLSGPHACLVYEVAGNGFLRHMVRTIVGTLVEIGRGRRPAANMADLVAGGARADAGVTAPARGLFLVRVDYDG